MVVESTCKENYFKWYRELVTVVYQGRGWVHAGKEEYFNHRHCLKLLAQGDNKKLTDLCLVLLFVLNPFQTRHSLITYTWVDSTTAPTPWYTTGLLFKEAHCTPCS